MNLTYDQFKAAMDSIDIGVKQIDGFEKAIQDAFDDSYLICTLGQHASRALITLLQDILDCGTWIEWFVHECDCGRKPMTYSVDGKDGVMDSLEKLWEVVKRGNTGEESV